MKEGRKYELKSVVLGEVVKKGEGKGIQKTANRRRGADDETNDVTALIAPVSERGATSDDTYAQPTDENELGRKKSFRGKTPAQVRLPGSHGPGRESRDKNSLHHSKRKKQKGGREERAKEWTGGLKNRRAQVVARENLKM